jgi:RES domain-containing protein
MPHPFDPRFLDAIERLGIRGWEGPVWRATVGDTPVLRTNTYGGRWNKQGSEAFYCSLAPEVAIAELDYLLGRQPVPVRAVRRVSRLHVLLGRVLDLSSDAAIESLGFAGRDLALEDSYSAPQHIAAAAEWLGIAGLLVPSARHQGTNLVVLVKNLTPQDVLDVLPEIE